MNESKRRSELWGIHWPGHPDAVVDGPIETSLRDEPECWRLLHTVGSDEPYEYDDYALMRHQDGTHALVRTTGCSCPSPTETWGVVVSGDLARIESYLRTEVGNWLPGALMAALPGQMAAWIEGNKEVT